MLVDVIFIILSGLVNEKCNWIHTKSPVENILQEIRTSSQLVSHP